MLKLWYWTYGRKMCAWCDAHSSWMQEDEKVEEINGQATCDVVASHPLFAELFKEIGPSILGSLRWS